MAQLNVVDDPARVHAVVVGLERYPRNPDWDLPGAVDDALRFYRWLRKGGVPEANIQLLLAPGEDSRCRLEPLTESGELTWQPTWQRGQLMDAFTTGLDGRSGDLLYVFWGSHGVLAQGDRRLLLCPEATPNDKRCISTANLLEYLQRDDLDGFGQQVLLFDACATFLEHHHHPTGPAIADFPTVRRRGVQQFALCAAAAGQVAENDAALSSGVFSHAVLDWLEANSVDLRPDLTALLTHVKGRTPELQTPVSIEIRSLDGSREELVSPGRAPLPASTGRSQLVLVLHGVLRDEDLRARCVEHLATHCPQVQLGPCPTDEQIAHALLTVERAMAAVVEVVGIQDRRSAEQLLALGRSHGAPGLLSPLEYASLEELLGRPPALPPMAHVIAAVRDAQPFAEAWLPPTVEGGAHRPTVAHLMACVEHFEEYTGGQSVAHPGTQLVPAVIRFTELLAALTPQVCGELREWGDRVARRLGVEEAGLAERRADALTWCSSLGTASGRPRVVALLDAEPPDRSVLGGGDGGERFTCALWAHTGSGDLAPAATQSAEPLSPREVVRSIAQTVSRLREATGETVLVEILLQPDAVQLPVDAWNGSDDGDLRPTLLGVEWETVLRALPLASDDREEQRRAALERRWAGRHDNTVIYLDDRHAEGYAAYGALMDDLCAARAVVRAGPGGRERLVQAALQLGCPVVLWDRQATGPVPDTYFAPLQPQAAVESLPERVRSYRAKTCADPIAHPVRPAVLLEAADRPLPPVLSLTELSEPTGSSDSEEASPR